jgi:zinc D-Ala-D-Ala carboxypeptidase
MRTAAAAAGVRLVILSATRNFDRQKIIWEDKWTGKRQVNGGNLSLTVQDPKQRALTILRYSSMPGTSRHHWGTDMDLNAFENDYFASGQGLKEYQWLQAHAAEYGFCQPYTAKGEDRPDGYEEEKWHWSYVPLSRLYLVAYTAKVNPADIQGFAGAAVAADIEVIRKYVLGVNTACF